METLPIHQEESINPLKSEHLIEGVQPIIACIGTEDQYNNEMNQFKLRGKDVDYYTLAGYRDEKYLGSNRHGYVISNIDSDMKYTEHLYDCTSVIAVGKEVDTDQEISFLTHQDSFNVSNESFKKDLKKRLQQLKKKCQSGTVDVVIVGGQLVPDRIQAMYYPHTLDTLNKLISEISGFKAVVVCGPKEPGITNKSKEIDSTDKYDNVYFDTKNRRLYVVRPENHVVYNDSFLASDIEGVNKKWKNNQK